MHKAFALWMAVDEGTKSEDLVTIDIFHVPQVVTYGYSDGLERKLCKRNFVYSKQRSHDDVLKMFRLCSMKGDDEVVFDSIGLETSVAFRTLL